MHNLKRSIYIGQQYVAVNLSNLQCFVMERVQIKVVEVIVVAAFVFQFFWLQSLFESLILIERFEVLMFGSIVAALEQISPLVSWYYVRKQPYLFTVS